ncbi:E3 ubiquitin-protein ligase COP1 [Folsomia candida]|uniref:E3 ubiquitin-protein ligase COP1 n=1 Tax=Folsomia candida TaxID=158441 RepID=UPI000B8FDA9C|nr:E3 ubiquitin-protein ligase COP1 [Folsomia candida]
MMNTNSQPTSSSSDTNPGSASTPTTTTSTPITVYTRCGPSAPRIRYKRPHALICNGKTETWGKAMSEYNCPICIGVLKEAAITRCGHTFCLECIKRSLDVKPICPQCGTAEQAENIVPNYVADQLVIKYLSTQKNAKTDILEMAKLNDSSPSEILQNMNVNKLNLNNIENLIMILQRKRDVLSAESRVHERTLLLEFLGELLKVKKAEKDRLEKEVHLIEQDLTQVTSRPYNAVKGGGGNVLHNDSESGDEGIAMSCSSSDIEGFNTQVLSCEELKEKSMSARRKRMHSHFDELINIYMDSRKVDLHDVRSNDATVPNDSGESFDYEDLDRFGSTLSSISRYSALKPLATLSYSADLLTNNNIVSSIEFDKDSEFFAIAGVTKKIKLFEYATVIGSAVDIHCPNAELLCNAKISCVAWSGYYKNRLGSSDYDGCVTIWDASTTQKIQTLAEHEKRVWSVDWSNGDPRLFASGSDDSKVKLWTTITNQSVATIEAKANVCCVKFCPQNSFIVAFGCADHCIHYYDFRHARQPLATLTGHKKAVSYVKFASKDELVSASTDSNLKLWNLQSASTECVRSFTGHINEKNFVGLGTDGNYIACGSENNSLYIYYRDISRPLLHFKFDNHRNMLDKPKVDDAGEFVSAVVWKKGSPVIVAANSQGSIKILELT